MPTRPLAPAGQTIEPSVSVPIVTVARFAAATTPEPELEPHGLRSSAYGLCAWPPTPLQPLDDWNPRKFAHSERFALPRTIAPAARRRPTMNASGARLVLSASEPAVVGMPFVPMLSLTMTGMPSIGRWTPFRRARSAARASSRAVLLTAITESSRPSSRSMRRR